MRTIDEGRTQASPDVCFQVAADVERWPEILSHYRWVRFHEKRDFADGVVEMAAWRPFGVVNYPTWWVSEMSSDAEARTVTYKHVDGITKGMDVLWEVVPDEDGSTLLRITHDWPGPAWPLIGGFAANSVIGPHFISAIAGRTLDGVIRTAESMGHRNG